MVSRSIVRIDEEKCTGCRLCIPACAEGAIHIVNGKAKIISEKYCDGLGACLGECPTGAITIEKREAEEFDEKAAQDNLKKQPVLRVHHLDKALHSRPSLQVTRFRRNLHDKVNVNPKEDRESMLVQWPVQLTLLPPNAPLENADLLIAADCVPFVYADFHNDLLKGKRLVIGCPKLDDAEFYKNKLTEIFRQNTIHSVTVVNMEVPCCFSLFRLAKEALDSSGKEIPIKQATISIKGNKISRGLQKF